MHDGGAAWNIRHYKLDNAAGPVFAGEKMKPVEDGRAGLFR
jgi:hypothetical protein